MKVAIVLQSSLASDLADRVAVGERPQTEMLALAGKLGAEVFDFNSAARSKNILVRVAFLVWKPLGPIILAFTRRREFASVCVANERQGIFLAALFKLLKRRPRLVIVNHNISNPKKAFLFNAFKLARSIDAFICLNKYQTSFVKKELGVPQKKVFRVDWGVDGSFFKPRGGEVGRERYILSVGREKRDYQTLFAALRDTPIRAKVLASSGYAAVPLQHRDRIGQAVQPNVEMYEDISYRDMRRLYDECSFVVVPLLRSFDFPAGVTAVVEAMAMGKAVIATYSRGIAEYIEDPVTGFWVEPNDPMLLRRKILLLWEQPQLAEEMGRRGRESVKLRIDLDRLAGQLASIVTAVDDHRT